MQPLPTTPPPPPPRAAERIAWLNGAFVALDAARVSVLDRGFLFADAIYEVAAVIGGRLVDLDWHLDRLERSCGEIGLRLPLPRANLAALHEEMVRRNALDEGLVYLQATRGAADRDFLPAPDLEPTLLLFTQARAVVDTPAARRGIAVATVPDLRWGRRDVKSVMLLAQVLAKREAAARGADDAWLVEDGVVSEGASSTAWIVDAAGTLVTRPDSRAVLPGVTARRVLAFAAEQGMAVERRAFSVAEAHAARECFNTSASGLVLPVISVDDVPIGDGTPGAVARALRTMYITFADGLRNPTGTTGVSDAASGDAAS